MTAVRALGRRLKQIDLSDDRGDVPGWVMVTLMTAGLVLGLWALAGSQLEAVFGEAMTRVLNF